MKQDSVSARGEAQQSLVAAMLDPAFYPSHPGEILHKETHISHVFLAGELVYKIKKPVRFSFLDFSILAKRRHFLEAELRLNRRLAPAVYLGVVPLFRGGAGWALDGAGKAAEYALLMRRLPDNRMLDYLLETRQATVSMMDQLADRLAAFHLGAEPVPAAPGEHLQATAAAWNENLSELKPLVADAAHYADIKTLTESGRRFLEKNADLIGRRASEGWIRDVHGDLHAEHICFAPEGIQIFDCIEFSDELRRSDLASEIAFLLMDLTVRGGGKLAQPFLRRYFSKLRDRDMPTLLPFYECYRAIVRAKVHALRLGRWNEEAARYFAFARRFKWQRFHPFVVLVSGFTGGGKSTLARALGERLGIAVIHSDAVRKSIAGKQGRELVPLNEGIYSHPMTEKTYHVMAREAERALADDRGVIVDGTFGRRAQREKFVRLAERRKIRLAVIRCMASDEISAERLRRRAAAGNDISDGRWEVYVAQKAAYEPMDEIDAAARFDLCTEAPLETLTDDAEAFLWNRLECQTVRHP